MEIKNSFLKAVKEEFIEIYTKNIKREGADAFLEFLLSDKSDFFVAPASTRYHNSIEGGLVDHSIKVYKCLKDYLNRDRVKELYGLEVSDDTAAVVSLLHDVCKINCYKRGFRNVKDDNGIWQKVPTFEYSDDMPYGHGEKSVYMISPYMKLTREEAFAIRYHMGFVNVNQNEIKNITDTYIRYPLAFALSTADMEATYYLEDRR